MESTNVRGLLDMVTNLHTTSRKASSKRPELNTLAELMKGLEPVLSDVRQSGLPSTLTVQTMHAFGRLNNSLVRAEKVVKKFTESSKTKHFFHEMTQTQELRSAISEIHECVSSLPLQLQNGEEIGPSHGDGLYHSHRSQQPINWMAVELRDVDPESIAAVVGRNPEPQLVTVPSTSSSTIEALTYPWIKGDLLGAGSFGTVYEAIDNEGRFFAVKEVSLVESDKQAQDAISELMLEVELLSKFKHENIVQYHGTDRADGKLYVFLEYAAKGSLASVYKKYKLTDSQISAYTRQILKGLKYLHDLNIVHRDVKCANILVSTTGICKLADFGMAKHISNLDRGKSTKGSACWMAPEVIHPMESYGNSADIWSLGCTVLEMATGLLPFSDMDWIQVVWAVGHGTAPPIPEFLSEHVKDFLKQCFQIKPSKRPTAVELLDHPFVRHEGGLTPTSSSSKQISKRSLEARS